MNSRHKTVAIFMAPFLILGGYILADIYKETQFAKADKALVLQNECRPLEKQCVILGRNLELNLSLEQKPATQSPLSILVESKTALDDMAITLFSSGNETKRIKLSTDDDKKQWNTKIYPDIPIDTSNLQIRMAVSYKGALHFAELPLDL